MRNLWELALKQRLLTNAKRAMHGFGSSSACSLCGHGYKDVLHIIRDCNTAKGFAVDGRCMRGHNGEWIIGFAKYLGNCIVLEAELWRILDKLNLILDRCFEKILIQTDNIDAINAILEDSLGSSNSTLVSKIHLILRKMEQWKIQYVPREENLIVDYLAKSVRTKRLGLRLFEYPPLRFRVLRKVNSGLKGYVSFDQ
ncbi:hypothetical protein J1N35_033016 [Gossypium stocksii]|uniref:RNase H type-1 domain-containing protein n=1 Tax=Gossypium stocksii TaxID=47602 RepID=A0A9D3ZMZ0_9ROSI|nr:hypothetical protein J1N35_033016 [Gossypium stocksii]